MNAVEVTITLKDAERTYKEKFLTYDTLVLHDADLVLATMVEKAKEGFKGQPEEILVKATMSYA